MSQRLPTQRRSDVSVAAKHLPVGPVAPAAVDHLAMHLHPHAAAGQASASSSLPSSSSSSSLSSLASAYHNPVAHKLLVGGPASDKVVTGVYGPPALPSATPATASSSAAPASSSASYKSGGAGVLGRAPLQQHASAAGSSSPSPSPSPSPSLAGYGRLTGSSSAAASPSVSPSASPTSHHLTSLVRRMSATSSGSPSPVLQRRSLLHSASPSPSPSLPASASPLPSPAPGSPVSSLSAAIYGAVIRHPTSRPASAAAAPSPADAASLPASPSASPLPPAGVAAPGPGPGHSSAVVSLSSAIAAAAAAAVPIPHPGAAAVGAGPAPAPVPAPLARLDRALTASARRPSRTGSLYAGGGGYAGAGAGAGAGASDGSAGSLPLSTTTSPLPAPYASQARALLASADALLEQSAAALEDPPGLAVGAGAGKGRRSSVPGLVQPPASPGGPASPAAPTATATASSSSFSSSSSVAVSPTTSSSPLLQAHSRLPLSTALRRASTSRLVAGPGATSPSTSSLASPYAYPRVGSPSPAPPPAAAAAAPAGPEAPAGDDVAGPATPHAAVRALARAASMRRSYTSAAAPASQAPPEPSAAAEAAPAAATAATEVVPMPPSASSLPTASQQQQHQHLRSTSPSLSPAAAALMAGGRRARMQQQQAMQGGSAQAPAAPAPATADPESAVPATTHGAMPDPSSSPLAPAPAPAPTPAPEASEADRKSGGRSVVPSLRPGDHGCGDVAAAAAAAGASLPAPPRRRASLSPAPSPAREGSSAPPSPAGTVTPTPPRGLTASASTSSAGETTSPQSHASDFPAVALFSGDAGDVDDAVTSLSSSFSSSSVSPLAATSTASSTSSALWARDHFDDVDVDAEVAALTRSGGAAAAGPAGPAGGGAPKPPSPSQPQKLQASGKGSPPKTSGVAGGKAGSKPGAARNGGASGGGKGAGKGAGKRGEPLYTAAPSPGSPASSSPSSSAASTAAAASLSTAGDRGIAATDEDDDAAVADRSTSSATSPQSKRLRPRTRSYVPPLRLVIADLGIDLDAFSKTDYVPLPAPAPAVACSAIPAAPAPSSPASGGTGPGGRVRPQQPAGPPGSGPTFHRPVLSSSPFASAGPSSRNRPTPAQEASAAAVAAATMTAEERRAHAERVQQAASERAYLSMVGLGDLTARESAAHVYALRQGLVARAQSQRTLQALLTFQQNHRYFSDALHCPAIALPTPASAAAAAAPTAASAATGATTTSSSSVAASPSPATPQKGAGNSLAGRVGSAGARQGSPASSSSSSSSPSGAGATSPRSPPASPKRRPVGLASGHPSPSSSSSASSSSSSAASSSSHHNLNHTHHGVGTGNDHVDVDAPMFILVSPPKPPASHSAVARPSKAAASAAVASGSKAASRPAASAPGGRAGEGEDDTESAAETAEAAAERIAGERERQQAQIEGIVGNAQSGSASIPMAIIRHIREGIESATASARAATVSAGHFPIDSVAARRMREATGAFADLAGSVGAATMPLATSSSARAGPGKDATTAAYLTFPSPLLQLLHAGARRRVPPPLALVLLGGVSAAAASSSVPPAAAVSAAPRPLTLSEGGARRVLGRVISFLPLVDLPRVALTCLSFAQFISAHPTFWAGKYRDSFLLAPRREALRQLSAALVAAAPAAAAASGPASPPAIGAAAGKGAAVRRGAAASGSAAAAAGAPSSALSVAGELAGLPLPSPSSPLPCPLPQWAVAGLARRVFLGRLKLERAQFGFNPIRLHPGAVTAAAQTPTGLITACEAGSGALSSLRSRPGHVAAACTATRLVCREAQEHIQVCAGMWAISQVNARGPVAPYHSVPPNLAHSHAVSGALYRGGGRAATISHDHSVKVWDAATGAHVKTLRGHAAPLTAIAGTVPAAVRRPRSPAAARPDPSFLADSTDVDCDQEEDAGEEDKDGVEGKQRAGDYEKEPGVRGLSPAVDAFAQSPLPFFTASRDGTVRMWHPSRAAALAVLPGTAASLDPPPAGVAPPALAPITALAVSDNSAHAAAMGLGFPRSPPLFCDGEATSTSTSTSASTAKSPLFAFGSQAIRLSGPIVMPAASSMSTSTSSILSPTPPSDVFPALSPVAAHAQFATGRALLAAGDEKGDVAVYDALTQSRLWLGGVLNGAVRSLTLAPPDSAPLMLVGGQHSLVLADVRVPPPPAHSVLAAYAAGGPPHYGGLSYGGAAGGGNSKYASMAPSAGAASCLSLLGHGGVVTAAVFAGVRCPHLPYHVLSACEDGRVRVFDVRAARAPLAVLTGHTAGVTSLDIHSSGDLLLTASRDKSLRLYSLVKPGFPVHKVFAGHKASVVWAQFGGPLHPDKLFSCDVAGTLAMWS